jgi:hypothetical protein
MIKERLENIRRELDAILNEQKKKKWIQKAITKDEWHKILGVPKDENIHDHVSPETAANKVASELGTLTALRAATARANAVKAADASKKAISFWNRVKEILKDRYAKEKERKK